MPSGKTHDAITFIFAVPIFAFAWRFGGSIAVAFIVTLAMLFGGLMFGPDLDTQSKPYTRWGICRVIWYPYKAFFKHRSRWSHGLIFGTLFRVVYFLGIITLISFACAYIGLGIKEGTIASLFEFTKNWQVISSLVHENIGQYTLLYSFAGLWLGAASHTFTDMAGTFIKTGRVTEFL